MFARAAEAIISEDYSAKGVQLQVRHLLNGTTTFKPGVCQVLIEFDHWLTCVAADGPKAAIARIADRELPSNEDAARIICDYLLTGVPMSERDLLRKSMIEILLSLFPPDMETDRSLSDRAVLNGVLGHFFRFQGGAALLRFFLSRHVFNLVWLKTMESFRMLARSQDSFMNDMQSLEQICSATVDACWESAQIQRPLNPDSVQKLLFEIGQRLTGEQLTNCKSVEP